MGGERWRADAGALQRLPRVMRACMHRRAGSTGAAACRNWVGGRIGTIEMHERLRDTFAFPCYGSVTMAARVQTALASTHAQHRISVLPATEITETNCNATFSAQTNVLTVCESKLSLLVSA